jgi:hypothetical protein
MTDYVGEILDNSKTISSARVLMIAVAYCTEWQEGENPRRGQMLEMVNVSAAELDRLIDVCVSIGELRVIPVNQNRRGPGDELEIVWAKLRGGAL